MEIAQIASHTTRMETPKKWVKRWSQGVRGPISAVKGVPSFALRRGKATLPRKPSREETPMRSPTCLWGGFSLGNFYPGELTKDSSTPEALQKLMVMLSKPRTVR